MNSAINLDEQRDPNQHDKASTANNHEEQKDVVVIEEAEDPTNGADEEQLMLHNQSAEETKPTIKDVMCADKEKTRKVSFPIDKDLVTGYFEPVNPWQGVSRVSAVELCNFYKASCVKHQTEPLEAVLNHLKSLDNTDEPRTNNLDLHNHVLSHENVECLEEILKRIQYKSINVSGCQLDDVSATAIFDMVEFYEAANELNISENKDITNRGWQSSINMVKRSQALEVLEASGVPISEISASNLGKALIGSCLHTVKLEHCGMTGRPIATFCHALRKVNVLKELWLANNDLNSFDAYNIGCLLKVNYSIQFLDISNNNIQDEGISYLADALIQQNNSMRNPVLDSNSSRLDYSELSASLNLLNNNKSLSPSFKKHTLNNAVETGDKQDRKPIHLLSKNNNNNDEENFLKDYKSANTKTKEKSPPPPNAEEILTENSEQNPLIIRDTGEETDDEVQNILQEASKNIDVDVLKQQESFMKIPEEKVTLNMPKNTKRQSELVALEQSTSNARSCGNPERSFSSESLNSLTSIDSNDSKSSIRIMEAKFAKNGTLERQQSLTQFEESIKCQTGLQVLLLWNNKITKSSSKSFSELISATTILEILNIGRNNVGNDFLLQIKPSLKANLSLTNLGLQACHLSCPGIKVLAEIIEFGGNSVLQRIDLRDNNIQSEGLEALNDALKSNKSITQIDLDDTPRKFSESFDSTNFNRLITNIRAHCKRNFSMPLQVLSNDQQQPTMTRVESSVRKIPTPSRKISLTCQNVQVPLKNTDTNTSSITTIKSPTNNSRKHLLTTSSSLPSSFTHCKKAHKKSSHFIDASKNRLKSPLPSPIVSPLASPSRNRFQVSKVNESKMSCSSVELSPSPTSYSSSRFSVTRVAHSSNLLTPSSACSTLSDSALSSSSTSLDSIDHHNELNVSMSSTDSFDMILRNVPMVEANYSKYPDYTNITRDTGVREALKLNDSLSSLEISLSSQESLDMPQKEENPQKVSSNEGTLTKNSPSRSPENEILDFQKPKTSDKRTRKTSSNYPATLDKLLNLFQPTNISQMFNRSSPDSIKKDDSIMHTKRDNTVGNLFAMVGLGTKKDNSENAENQTKSNVLQQNVFSDINLPEHTLYVDSLSNDLKKEVKENISSDNTITASSVSNMKLEPFTVLSKEEETVSPHKVVFELGGEDQDEIPLSLIMQSEAVQNSSDFSATLMHPQPKDQNKHLYTSGSGLGNIARDSLSIIKGGVNTSQDSMRSLDSLPEFEQFDCKNDAQPLIQFKTNNMDTTSEKSFHGEVEKNCNQLTSDAKNNKKEEVQNISPVYY